MSSEHPTYPNPTITETVCDIHFRLSEGKEWKPSLPGVLFKYIQNEYPEMEPVVEIGLQLERGPLGTGTKFAPQRQKVRFKHRIRPLVLQLAENSLSINTLPPYQGWKVMLNDSLAAWQKVTDILQPKVITRIGLRYIKGMPTADNKALDGDVILAAQATMLENYGHTVIIATTNVNHLSRLANTKQWREIV